MLACGGKHTSIRISNLSAHTAASWPLRVTPHSKCSWLLFRRLRDLYRAHLLPVVAVLFGRMPPGSCLFHRWFECFNFSSSCKIEQGSFLSQAALQLVFVLKKHSHSVGCLFSNC